jgi:hypothetical protein
MSRPKWSLHGPITADQSVIQVRQVVRIDDEIMYLFWVTSVPAVSPTWRYSWRTRSATPIPGQPAHGEWRAIRGRRGTVAAPHDAGAEIEYLEMDVF